MPPVSWDFPERRDLDPFWDMDRSEAGSRNGVRFLVGGQKEYMLAVVSAMSSASLLMATPTSLDVGAGIQYPTATAVRGGLREFRCEHCRKLLGRYSMQGGRLLLEVRCSRCRSIAVLQH